MQKKLLINAVINLDHSICNVEGDDIIGVMLTNSEARALWNHLKTEWINSGNEPEAYHTVTKLMRFVDELDKRPSSTT